MKRSLAARITDQVNGIRAGRGKGGMGGGMGRGSRGAGVAPPTGTSGGTSITPSSIT